MQYAIKISSYTAHKIGAVFLFISKEYKASDEISIWARQIQYLIKK